MSLPSNIQEHPTSGHAPPEPQRRREQIRGTSAAAQQLPVWITLLSSGVFLAALGAALALTEGARQHTVRGWIRRQRRAA